MSNMDDKCHVEIYHYRGWVRADKGEFQSVDDARVHARHMYGGTYHWRIMRNGLEVENAESDTLEV